MPSKYQRAWLAATLAALAIVIAIGIYARPRPPAAEAPAGIFGVTLRGEWWEPPIHQLARDAGITWVRGMISWAAQEPAPGVISFDESDIYLQVLTAAGFKPVIFITHNPTWAAASPCGPVYDPADLARFMGALAARYNGQIGARVDYWALYNEPDNNHRSGIAATYGGCWGSAPAAYAAAMRLVRAAIRAANPEAKLILGIAGEYTTCDPTWECTGELLFNHTWTEEMLDYMDANPATYFDVFDFHYYPAFHDRWDPYGLGITGKLAYYRALLADHGITVPMISTETGINADDETQSNYLVQTYVRAMAGQMDAVLWFTMADIPE